MKVILKISFFYFLFFLCLRVEAAGFMQVRNQSLATEVKKEHTADDIAQKLAQVAGDDLSWIESQTPSFRLYLALRWTEQGYVSQALHVLDGLVTDTPDLLLWRYLRASILIRQDQVTQAKPLLEALLRDLPEDEDVLFLKSSYLAQTGDLRGAIDALDVVIKNDSRNGSAYLQRGLLNVLTFAQDKACDDFFKALRHLPDDDIAKRQQALLQMGLVQLKHYNDAKKAEKLFKKGIDLDPNSTLVTQLRERIY